MEKIVISLRHHYKFTSFNHHIRLIFLPSSHIMLQLERITPDQNNSDRQGNKRIKRSRTKTCECGNFYKELKTLCFMCRNIWRKVNIFSFNICFICLLYIRRRNYKPSFITLLLLSARLVFPLFFRYCSKRTHMKTYKTYAFPTWFYHIIFSYRYTKKKILSVKYSVR